MRLHGRLAELARLGATGEGIDRGLFTPAERCAKNSELDISARSNSRFPAMRSKISRAPDEPSMRMKFNVIPAGRTSPV